MIKKRKKPIIKTLAITGIILFITFLIFHFYKMDENIEIVDNYTAERTKISTNNEQNVENEVEKSISTADMIENITKSVCGISKLSNTGGSILSTATESELGLGTGIIVSSNGYILSNSHVTGEKYSSCYVTIEENNTFKGTVVWADTTLDLSLTKINAENLLAAKYGNSKDVRVGETVYAIGNPIGLQFRRTVTSGIISAINRTVKIEENGNDIYMADLIQTDATINPGNSGGPLINTKGEVIGINSVKITSAEGIGFAIPIDVVKPVIESFVSKGYFEEPTLGVFVYDEYVSKYMNLNKGFSSGIYVSQVIKGGPADGKGLKEGDIITKIDGERINTINELRRYVYSKNPGDKVTLNVNKGKYSRDIEITLGKR